MRDRLIELIMKAEAEFIETHRPILDVERYVADYLLANGVIVPPCKVGQKLYTTYCYGIRDWRIEESVIYEVRQRIGTGLEIFEMRKNENGTFSYFKVELDKFGKTVFLTKEEAEQALKGGEG